ncbi:uncharacterized protein PFL1_05835 [Pseudozyma flocculosa PF-1]|uniref:Large ribosomal subunit protein uL29m n=2 Tax=Pseudozyma flocculosa TaxID=84751 RepID=A0A5C3F210_9BASI|nr:uncharacterized protein PFL1_05835 [Pseudozyma flocculosa PF-1]EPQ26513.1 hypothetical protein PFL1_05835 [Pseudozyma flocculosa PF-1]SPO38498.1 uncharacterized protein PSFLO_03976 [Pseudozyma flocculosa]
MMTLRSALTRLKSRGVAGPSRLLSTSSVALQAPVPVPTKPASQSRTRVPTDQVDQLRSYPAHPLLQFFHTHASLFPSDLAHPPTTAVVQTAESSPTNQPGFSIRLPHAVHKSDLGKNGSGRAWLAAELRTKSSKDLHTLWYVLLQERNRLATSWEELGRIGGRQAAKMWNENLSRRNHRVRKSMARIKLVLNERRLALIEAQKQVREGVEYLEPEADDGADLFEETTPAPAAATQPPTEA